MSKGAFQPGRRQRRRRGSSGVIAITEPPEKGKPPAGADLSSRHGGDGDLCVRHHTGRHRVCYIRRRAPWRRAWRA